MDGFLGRYSTYIYAILRIVTGFLFMWHGSQKLFGFPPPSTPAAASFRRLWRSAAAIELIGGLLIMIGLFTRIAAFICERNDGGCIFRCAFQHCRRFLPIANSGELAVVYCFLFLYIASRGSGVWSVDSIFRGSRNSEGS